MKRNRPPEDPPPHPPAAGEILLKNLRRKGYRFSESRRHLILILAKSRGPVSVQEIHRALRHQAGCESISLMTVYRHITLLWREGYLARVGFADGAFRYVLTQETDKDDRCDLVLCRKCSALYRFRTGVEEWAVGDAGTRGYAIARHRLVFYGLCRECQRGTGLAILAGWWAIWEMGGHFFGNFLQTIVI